MGPLRRRNPYQKQQRHWIGRPGIIVVVAIIVVLAVASASIGGFLRYPPTSPDPNDQRSPSHSTADGATTDERSETSLSASGRESSTDGKAGVESKNENRNGSSAGNDGSSSSAAPMGAMIYGTNRAGPRTAALVRDAVSSGFRHIATACRHKQYNEAGVGEGWTEAAKSSIDGEAPIRRSDLYLQTMFVPSSGADYDGGGGAAVGGDDEARSIAAEVERSVAESLRNLRTTYIDAVLYHNFRAKLQPYEEILEAWRALESHVERGTVRHLGLTNIHDLEYLSRLMADAKIRPSIVQNRFHSNRSFDVNLRQFFVEHEIRVQRFWILTGNGGLMRRDDAKSLAKELDLPTVATLMYAFVLSLGDSPLIGTRSIEHMKEDVALGQRHGLSNKRIFRDEKGLDEDRKQVAKMFGMKYP